MHGTRTLRWAMAVAVPVSLGVWASSRAEAPVDTAHVLPSPKASTCPLGMLGTRVSVHDREDGIDVAFTADHDVEQLRRRVHDQAAHYGPGAHKGLGHHGVHAGDHQHGLRLWNLPPVRLSVDDTDLGATIHVAAESPAREKEVSWTLHSRIDELEYGACPPFFVSGGGSGAR